MSLDNLKDTSLIGIEGHIKIWDPESGEVISQEAEEINGD